MRNKIYLIGSMGSGKTTIGKMLASKLHLPFIDIDKKIEQKEKMVISDIFKENGENYFRKIESDILTKYSALMNLLFQPVVAQCLVKIIKKF